MLSGLEIQNFRCFETVQLIGLRRINVIVGENSAGKTSLLESLFMVCGGPDIAFRLRTWRGLGDRVPLNVPQLWEESPWRDIFYQYDKNKAVYISLRDSDELTRSLRIHSKPSQAVLIPPQSESSQIQEIAPITFEWSKGNKILGSVQPILTPKGFQVEGAPEPLKASFFASAILINPVETATRFSSLSKQRQEATFIREIRMVFPQIENLSVEVEAGSPMVHATLANMPLKVPIGLVSAGVNKLIGLLGGLAQQRLILIDEIENGFYYKRMPDIWSSIYRFAFTYGSQVFASTHSRECLEALLPAMEGRENEFCLLRTRKEAGRAVVDTVAGKDLKSALEERVEIR